MNGRQISGERLAALFILGALLLNAPFLIIFDKPVLVWGVPLLYAYIFAAWAGLIACTAYVMHFAREPDEPTGANASNGVAGSKPATDTPQRREPAPPPSSANSTESRSSC